MPGGGDKHGGWHSSKRDGPDGMVIRKAASNKAGDMASNRLGGVVANMEGDMTTNMAKYKVIQEWGWVCG